MTRRSQKAIKNEGKALFRKASLTDKHIISGF